MNDNVLENEFDAVEEITANEDRSDSTGAGILRLSKPFMVDGEKIRQIEYDLTQVRPIQYINLVKRLSKKEEIPVPELNIDVQVGYFSLASGISVSDLKNMPNTQDFTTLCGKVRSFLLGASATENEEE